ncbi:MAG: CotH kinase family protein [Casimicrobiaceae bacterium]
MIARVACRIALALGCVAVTAGQSHTPEPGAAFFRDGAPQRFELELSPEAMAALRTLPREDVTGTVRVGGVTYTNVAIHLKGVATFRPVDDQPSLTLNFAKLGGSQRFDGLRKIHLNNGKEDPTFLCESLAAGMFAMARLPVARVALARTTLNGRDLGPYVAIEGFTEEFLGRYFSNTKGNLYDSGFRHDITAPLEKLSGKEPDDWADLKALAAAGATLDLEERWTALTRVLDTDSFARYLAMQVITANWDGYAMFKNNYRVYHDPGSGRITFIPHGMDQTFARTSMPLVPLQWEGALARQYLETAQGQVLYRKQLALLFASTYHSEALAGRADELAARVRPMLAERGDLVTAQYDRLVAGLRSRILQRGEFLARLLAGGASGQGSTFNFQLSTFVPPFPFQLLRQFEIAPAINHVREPGQWKPVAGGSPGEGPADPSQGQPGQDVRVRHHIVNVVEVDELEGVGRGVDRVNRDKKPEGDPSVGSDASCSRLPSGAACRRVVAPSFFVRPMDDQRALQTKLAASLLSPVPK